MVAINWNRSHVNNEWTSVTPSPATRSVMDCRSQRHRSTMRLNESRTIRMETHLNRIESYSNFQPKIPIPMEKWKRKWCNVALDFTGRSQDVDFLRDARVRGARSDPQQRARHQRRLLVAGRTHVRAPHRHAPFYRIRPHEDVQHHPEGHRRRRVPPQHHPQRLRPHQETLPVHFLFYLLLPTSYFLLPLWSLIHSQPPMRMQGCFYLEIRGGVDVVAI